MQNILGDVTAMVAGRAGDGDKHDPIMAEQTRCD
jgi:hypothetical protein